ncbi:MAG TPA: asparagine synthase (glutamine-hydrolyzing) [Candidatus Paceibacterota bacterium]|nr:asparagine synthase (glutamine-hydrolyzing) [Verrucomicrobiota bacterium]HSA08825.1 asparagine synthase (glutamine-hydrolyzing) [Candidatus Paceibacterota bacterium]
MCGIAGIVDFDNEGIVAESEMRRMLATLRNRGPDQFGIYLDRGVALGNSRLSIIDLASGQQPISNEDGSMWIVFNGEIFNYVELRPELEALGHRFSTDSDTEVLLHMYEQFGPRCLERLNGQFAFAVWDNRTKTLFLARDRLGVRPLFYAVRGQRLVFGSAIKTLLTQPRVSAEIDTAVLDQVFTFWAPLSPHTIFRHIQEIPPGHFLVARHGEINVKPYWQLDFPDAKSMQPRGASGAEQHLEELSTLLVDAIRIRLRADVPVGAYLSGGLDSSLIAALVRNSTANRLSTFSIAFSDAQYDESAHQTRMARFLGTEHQVACVTHGDIGRVFPEVVWNAEAPLMRTAPAPMFLLSKLVRDSGFKVVLTGEGADEFLAGYDIFKEAKVRRFWARQPDSIRRPMLLRRLYPDIAGLSGSSASLLSAFFREGLTRLDNPEYSHAVRWRNNQRTRRFFTDDVLHSAAPRNGRFLAAELPGRFGAWDDLARAQHLEISIFLSQYLLSSQGDRMAMANSVEGRFPFLDCRVVEFCNRLPANLKLRALTEKYLLRKLGARWLPEEVWGRRKRPYRAPIHRSFFGQPNLDYVEELLSPAELRRSGLFRPAAVAQLVRKIQEGKPLGETDDMALVGIISTQLLHHQFVTNINLPPPISDADCVKVCVGPGASNQKFEHEIHQECTCN